MVRYPANRPPIVRAVCVRAIWIGDARRDRRSDSGASGPRTAPATRALPAWPTAVPCQTRSIQASGAACVIDDDCSFGGFCKVFPTCSGSSNFGAICRTDTDCPGSVCHRSLPTCVPGANKAAFCSSDSECPGSTCGAEEVCARGTQAGNACDTAYDCAGGTCPEPEAGGLETDASVYSWKCCQACSPTFLPAATIIGEETAYVLSDSEVRTQGTCF